MYFHITVQNRAATVWRRCSVAVVVDRWRCRPDVEGGVRLLGPFIKKNRHNLFFIYFILAKKFVKQTVR